MARWSVLTLGLLFVTRDVFAGSLEIGYSVLERILVEHVLTEGGRLYLQGGPEDTCNYAFVQEPRVSQESGRLQLRFLFAGSAGKEVAGRCVGKGDNFDIVVHGVPRYAEGEIFLDDTQFQGDSPVFNLFSPLIERAMRPRLRLPLRRDLETRVGTLLVKNLEVGDIVLGSDAIIVETSIDVAIRPIQPGVSR